LVKTFYNRHSIKLTKAAMFISSSLLHIIVVCVLATLSNVQSWSSSNGNFNIKSIRQSLIQNHQNILRTSILPAAASILLGKVASAEATQGKLEYQPALQGLDYGKVRTILIYYSFKIIIMLKLSSSSSSSSATHLLPGLYSRQRWTSIQTCQRRYR